MTWDQPSKGVCVKLGSALTHAEEAKGKGGHQFDIDALAACITDPEVQAWLKSFPSVFCRKRGADVGILPPPPFDIAKREAELGAKKAAELDALSVSETKALEIITAMGGAKGVEWNDVLTALGSAPPHNGEIAEAAEKALEAIINRGLVYEPRFGTLRLT